MNVVDFDSKKRDNNTCSKKTGGKRVNNVVCLADYKDNSLDTYKRERIAKINESNKKEKIIKMIKVVGGVVFALSYIVILLNSY